MLRVVHGPVNIGNQPWAISQQERQLGVRSEVVVNYNTWLEYPVDRCLGEYGDRSWQTRLRRARFAWTAPLRYDVLHYYFGRSFSCMDDYGARNRRWFRDLRMARRLGKRVFMTLQGCDVRLSKNSSDNNEITMCREGHCGAVPTCRSQLDAERRWLIEEIIPLANRAFVLNPELAKYVPGSAFLPYAVDISHFETVPPRLDRPPVILHAPSDEGVKGSSYVIQAIERLKQRHELEFVLVKGLPHAEAMKLYRDADLVIDQLLAGWYGAFAVELMAMGKPVAAYIRDEDLDCLPPGMREELPLLQVTPDTIEQDLEAALLRRTEWVEWGERARRFSQRWHDPRRLARALIDAYRDPESRFVIEPDRKPICAE